jgi:very-short-patch-repair endonuclease
MYSKFYITKLARKLRKNQTKEVDILWETLRGRKLSGYKFLRQYPIKYLTINEQTYFFIADFYCDDKKTVIELDGRIHDLNQEYDNLREIVIKEKGLNILRIKNEELFDMESVKLKILSYLNNY